LHPYIMRSLVDGHAGVPWPPTLAIKGDPSRTKLI